MDLKEIRQIIEMMKRHDLSLFHLERDGIKIKLKKGVDFETLVKTVSQSGGGGGGGYAGPPSSGGMRFDPLLPATGSAGIEEGFEAPSSANSGSPSGPTIKSPMVGTFYRCPAPDEPPFSKDGDRVAEDQVICIIEAMKVMNEIKAQSSGVIVRCLVNDGTPVQFDQPLFEVRPA